MSAPQVGKDPGRCTTPDGRYDREGDALMIVPDTRHAWTAEVRQQAHVALRVATQSDNSRVLAYYLRCCLAHGMTLDEVCEAGNLSPAVVRELTDPAVAP